MLLTVLLTGLLQEVPSQTMLDVGAVSRRCSEQLSRSGRCGEWCREQGARQDQIVDAVAPVVPLAQQAWQPESRSLNGAQARNLLESYGTHAIVQTEKGE